MTTEKIRTNWENIEEVLGAVTPQEAEKIEALKALGTSAGKCKDIILADRKAAEKAAKKAAEKAEKEKALQEALKAKKERYEAFKALIQGAKESGVLEKPFTFTNIDRFASFKGRTWEAESVRTIQGEQYLCCLEYDKEGRFDLPCFINLKDFLFEEGKIKIACYFKDDLPYMVYDLISK